MSILSSEGKNNNIITAIMTAEKDISSIVTAISEAVKRHPPPPQTALDNHLKT